MDLESSHRKKESIFLLWLCVMPNAEKKEQWRI